MSLLPLSVADCRVRRTGRAPNGGRLPRHRGGRGSAASSRPTPSDRTPAGGGFNHRFLHFLLHLLLQLLRLRHQVLKIEATHRIVLTLPEYSPVDCNGCSAIVQDQRKEARRSVPLFPAIVAVTESFDLTQSPPPPGREKQPWPLFEYSSWIAYRWLFTRKVGTRNSA